MTATTEETTEVLIIGGGLAGPAAAIHLARAGRRVTLIERSATPHHKVCGEFLSTEALTYLSALGVDVDALGAVPIDTVDLGGIARRLPFPAKSLTRCQLDEDLLRIASAAGVTVLRGNRVRSLEPCPTGWTATLEDNTNLTAPAAFLATGKHDLTGHPRPKGVQPGLVGLKMYLRLSPTQTAALRARVELILYPGGYGGLQPVENGIANLCCLIDSHHLQHLSGNWDSLLRHMTLHCPQLRQRLTEAQPILAKPLAIAAIPYGYVRPATAPQPGLWALGDQTAVIPSFTGDGMSIALHTGTMAAKMYLSGSTSAAYQTRMQHDLRRQVALATAISRGLGHPISRPLMLAAARLFPTLLTRIAQQTRIASAATL